MLVDSSIANLCQCIAIGSLQVNCVFLAITLKVLITRKKSMGENATSNKDTVKYNILHLCLVIFIMNMYLET